MALLSELCRPTGIYQRRVNRLHVGDLIGSFPKRLDRLTFQCIALKLVRHPIGARDEG
jgi:hypothetical protein